MEMALKLILWLSVFNVVLFTAGYPLVLALLAAFVNRKWHRKDAEPTVSLVIAAYNEESCIAHKLENSLALDYPRERIEIIVASDGSTDRTDEIVRSFENKGIELSRFPRTGKTGMQNRVAKAAKGDIIVFSDANAMYRRDAIRKLVRNFADPSIACVSGQLVYQTDGEGAGNSERSYWDYEKFMKRCESRLCSLIGANGSIYAIRRIDYVEIPDELISDLVEPLALVKAGKRVVYEPEAISIEEASTSYNAEFRRKVRILTRSIRGLLYMKELLNPLRYGFFSIQLIVHKLFRYLVPFLLIAGSCSMLMLAAMGSYRGLLLLMVAAVLAALLVGGGVLLRDNESLPARVCHLLYYYLMVNTALVMAWINILRGMHMVRWAPARKDSQ